MATCLLNPGHHVVFDAGAVSPRTGLRETDVAITVSNKAAEYLNAAGVYTQTYQANELYEITDFANSGDFDVFVSIHCNSAANQSAQGTETWVYTGSVNGDKLGRCIQNQIVNSLPVTDRGMKYSTGLYVLKHTDMPACLIELAFISNEYDESLLSSDYYTTEFARSVARGVTDYFVCNL